jgi:hypothetical protein
MECNALVREKKTLQEDSSDLTRSNISPNADKPSQYSVNREI